MATSTRDKFFLAEMSDIKREDLKKEIVEILKDADLDNTSAKKVRIQLQEKLEVDLTERKKGVDQLVMEVIDEQTQEEEDEEGEEDGSEEEAPPSDGGGSDYEPDRPVKTAKKGDH